jgi:tRNA threonylcarbamoyladenosine biosynthesis protein TsaB
MMILAIDTATQYAGLALYQSDGIFAETYWFSGRNHTVELMPRLVRMLEHAHLTMADVTALAVSLGPGSFTGLRIGLAVAKGLALPHRQPVVGIPTLEIVSAPFRDSSLPVWAVAQAGRGRILAACYAQRKKDWVAIVEPHLTNFADLNQEITRPALCTGEIDAEAAALLEQNSRARVVSVAGRARRAGYLAELAALRLESGLQEDPDALEPLYLSAP